MKNVATTQKSMPTVFLSISFFLSFLAYFVPSLRNFLRASLRFFEQLEKVFSILRDQRSNVNECHKKPTHVRSERLAAEREADVEDVLASSLRPHGCTSAAKGGFRKKIVSIYYENFQNVKVTLLPKEILQLESGFSNVQQWYFVTSI